MKGGKGIQGKKLFLSFLSSFGAEGVSALFTLGSTQIYQTLQKPPLSPPGAVFGIVWTALFFLLGLSLYLVWTAADPPRRAFWLYGAQLIVNVLWPFWFFKLQLFYVSFLWILLLIVLVIGMAVCFAKVRRAAGLLQVPYLIWLCFAGYLSIGVAVLNPV